MVTRYRELNVHSPGNNEVRGHDRRNAVVGNSASESWSVLPNVQLIAMSNAMFVYRESYASSRILPTQHAHTPESL